MKRMAQGDPIFGDDNPQVDHGGYIDISASKFVGMLTRPSGFFRLLQIGARLVADLPLRQHVSTQISG